MKCEKCGNDVFKGQFRCEKCGTIIVEKKVSDDTEKKIKENKKNGK